MEYAPSVNTYFANIEGDMVKTSKNDKVAKHSEQQTVCRSITFVPYPGSVRQRVQFCISDSIVHFPNSKNGHCKIFPSSLATMNIVNTNITIQIAPEDLIYACVIHIHQLGI